MVKIDGFEIFMFLMGILVVCFLTGSLVDVIYKHPQAAEIANNLCQEQGYDFYEKFLRVGIWSTTPVAIKCQYVSSYSEKDLNINGNVPVVLAE